MQISTKHDQESVDKALYEYKQKKVQFDEVNFAFYHPGLKRDAAESILKEDYMKNYEEGVFLLRNCSSSPEDFTLSVIYHGKVSHCKIMHVIDKYYSIDDQDSQPFHGIDLVIITLQAGNSNLPFKLSKRFVKSTILPKEYRFTGLRNMLHEAAAKQLDEKTGRLILNSRYCPDLDDYDQFGRHALDYACEEDNMYIIKILVNRNPKLIHLKTQDGFTLMHRVANSSNSDCALKFLLKQPNINAIERNLSDYNKTPLHLAAYVNNMFGINHLLNYGVPYMPRDAEGKTPLDYADDEEAKNILSKFKPKKAKEKQHNWLHDSSVNRENARRTLFYKSQKKGDGVFLVRLTNRVECYAILSLIHKNEFYNYEIVAINNDSLFYIDDGPLFNSLEHLIDHYMKFEDGLPGKLVTPIEPEKKVKPTSTAEKKARLNIVDKPTLTPPPQQDTLFRQHSNSSSNKSLPHDVVNRNAMIGTLNREKKPSRKELEIIELGQIKIGEKLGQGEFGEVFKGTYKSKSVAIKCLKDFSAKEEFKREAKIMASLSDNPYILKIIGIVDQKGSYMMVQELMMCCVLHKLYEGPQVVTADHIKQWASQIVSGMSFMEKKNIVHRDLAARNILLASMEKVKISDFGLSRCVETSQVYTQQSDGKIPIKWYAPESIEKFKFTSKSDVWSYGITLWELFSYGQPPYGFKNGTEVYYFLKGNQRLDRPKDCPINTWNRVILRCWEWSPEKRPSFDELQIEFYRDPEYQGVETCYYSNNIVLGSESNV